MITSPFSCLLQTTTWVDPRRPREEQPNLPLVQSPEMPTAAALKEQRLAQLAHEKRMIQVGMYRSDRLL